MAGPTKRIIYVYQGLGALEESNKVLMSQLLRFVNTQVHSLQFISPEETIKGFWCDKAALYIIGGGYDLGLIKALGSEGTDRIKKYVEQGGSYLGICSGAYFACSYIEFDKNGPLEVCGERQLKFYPGGKIGPLFGPYRYNSEFGSRAVSLSCQLPQPITLTNEVTCSRSPVHTGNGFSSYKLEQFYAYFSGGGAFYPYPEGSMETKRIPDNYHQMNGIKTEEQTYFIESVRSEYQCGVNSTDEKIASPFKVSPNKNNVEVLCSYTHMKGKPAAIVKCSVGKGKAVLSSVHIEYDSQCLDNENVYLKPLISSLRSYDTQQSLMFRYMLNCLGVNINLNVKQI